MLKYGHMGCYFEFEVTMGRRLECEVTMGRRFECEVTMGRHFECEVTLFYVTTRGRVRIYDATPAHSAIVADIRIFYRFGLCGWQRVCTRLLRVTL